MTATAISIDNTELIALSYAERYGIIDYSVADGKMIYRESFPTEGTYEATVDLSTLKEIRRKI